MSDIKDHFIFCGKPKYSGDEIVGWIPSYVRIDLVKSIHVADESISSSLIYTYKDQWYAVSTPINELLEKINIYINKHSKDDYDQEQSTANKTLSATTDWKGSDA